MREIARVMHARRKELGLTLQGVGELAGLHWNTIWRYEACETAPRVPDLLSWAKALGMTVEVKADA